jgi:hypothetical protein
MKTFFSFILLFVVLVRASAQQEVPFLERSISISFATERLDIALKKIGEQGGFTFSYNPSIIESEKKITKTFFKKTVREILDELFHGTLTYKARANHIILTRSKETSKNSDDTILSGYIIDEATGERLRNVSVYDPVTLTSAVTDSYGYFEIKFDKPVSDINLKINKQNYSDTVITVPASTGRLLNIPMKIDKQKWITVADSVSEKLKRFWNNKRSWPNKILHPKKANLVNIRDTLSREVQFSVVPFLGTNQMLSGNVVNDYSVNVVGGFARGVRKFEVGGVFNIDREDVQGAQFAGLFNVVGGKVAGWQMAGLFNADFDEFSGAQFAGLANVSWSNTSVFSAAGALNLTRLDSRGVHLAGLANLTIGEQQGPHAAGVFNFSASDASAIQAAGAWNFTAKNMKGAQLAGVLNFTGKNVQGTQMAGVLNFAGKKVTGAQIAGVLNYATKVRGVQLGLVNIADSVQGASIGLFSFVMKGYHKLEFSADEIFYTNVAFRSGVRNFYNIFTAGAKPNTFENDITYWTFGYGIGTSSKLTRWLFLDLDVTANQIMHERDIKAMNLLNKLYLGFDVQIAKKLSFTFGATLNAYITDNLYDGYLPLFTDYTPSITRDENTSNDYNVKMWLGGKVGIRFF